MTADALLKRQISDLLLCLGILYRETYNQRARVFLWGLNRKVCNKGKGESPVNIMEKAKKRGEMAAQKAHEVITEILYTRVASNNNRQNESQ
jgi:hypothetical protein